ncbi:MAG: acyl-ACP--UDP-N-acetylglucosamine O-acyltransferase [Phycisphaerales bacterium]|nr:MAG: acyl-ACP--UDP-N-acetylglucosamine O-acyltransferase [Phycisphaerales bacterium]
MSIHRTAIVDCRAQIGADVTIGPYSVIGPHVVIGDRCRIGHQVTLDGHTTLGPDCQVFPGALLGLPPQDVKFRGADTLLEIGEGNVFREMVTAHPGTEGGGGVTRIGDRNLFLIGVHVAHDCQIGDHCIVANYTQFAGHVRVEDHVNMGGHAAVHHFVTIGRHAFIGGMTRVVADVPPYMVIVAARGTRSEVRMVNGVGLQRCGFSTEQINNLRKAFMRLYSRRARTSGSPIRDRVSAILSENPGEHVEYLCRFLLRSFEHGRHGRYLESLRPDNPRANRTESEPRP